MKRLLVLVSLALVAPLVAPMAAAAAPSDPGPASLYLGQQPDIHPVVTPEDQPITWGAAPPIDEHYGGTLYAGTSIEQPDPRPALDGNAKEPLRAWMADPADGRTGRPAIIWIHGGGFAVGIDSMWDLANHTAKEYAKRGYVGFSIEYRIDTTLIGSSVAGRPPSLCQWVQDNRPPVGTDDPVWTARAAQCARNLLAAQHDALASVRWLRQHAAEYGVDPDRIAVAGFSAGAVTAANTAYQSDDVGDVTYFPGDSLSPAASKPAAAFGASGCVPTPDGTPPTTIGAGDAPFAMIQSINDGAVEYSCVRNTIAAARAAGLVAELTSYCAESGHAAGLYRVHPAATDLLWTNFLARELGLYSDLRPATTAGFCTGPIEQTQLGHYVIRSFQDLLGRAPDAVELARGVDRVSSSGAASFEGDLVASREHLTLVMRRLYSTVLARDADDAGLAYWADQMQAGVRTRDVAIAMYASTEYYAKHGGAPGSYVAGLYHSILDREPDPAGFASWSALAGDRGRVAAAFYQSLESRQRRVTDSYRELLERSVDTGGRDYWAALLFGQDDQALVLNVVAGDEYFHNA